MQALLWIHIRYHRTGFPADRKISKRAYRAERFIDEIRSALDDNAGAQADGLFYYSLADHAPGGTAQELTDQLRHHRVTGPDDTPV